VTKQKQRDTEYQTLMGKAIGDLTDSKAYQERLEAMASELGRSEGDTGVGGGGNEEQEATIRDGWSNGSEDDDLDDDVKLGAITQRDWLPPYATTP
jgi:hypothetical protein